MRDFELLRFHDEYRNQLSSKIKQVRKRLEKNEKRSISGILKYHRSKSGKFYYSLISSEDNTETYLKKENRNIAVIVAQMEYDRKFLETANEMLKMLDSFDKHVEECGIEDVFTKLSESKKQLVSPIQPDMERFAAEWEYSEYDKKPISEDIPRYKTQKNEIVRSKSELIIANTLYEKGIPYKYECPLEICGRIIHPDFTILNKNTGKIMYWEHLGMMDDTPYRNEALKRISNYESAGIFSGVEIIYTMENYTKPLTTTEVEAKIRKYIM